MSIKKSLRISIILTSIIPLIFMTVLFYFVSYNKYLELVKNSASEMASTYAEGFSSQLNVQKSEIEGISNVSLIQQIALESYNGLTLGTDSTYYEPVKEFLESTTKYMNNMVNFYIYDLSGYFIVGSDESDTRDWSEYMEIPISDITETTVLKSSVINKEGDAIEIITPIKVKNTTVGLIKAKINSSFFGSYIPSTGEAFILTSNGDYLFETNGFTSAPRLKNELFALWKDGNTEGYITNKNLSIKNIYGYCQINDDWLYIIKLTGNQYQKILSALPVILVIMLGVIMIVSIRFSSILANKYTAPILSIKEKMTDATKGNLNVVCDIETDDEFGELSDKFNTMMNIISSNYNQLDESKKILEANELELKKNYEEIEKLAYHDGLTGLYNRIAFTKFSNEKFNADGSALSRHAIFFIDLDNFKNVNDTLGHDYGDLLLIQVSEQLSDIVDPTDILARTGGDEFLIFKSVFSNTDDLKDFAESLINLVNKPFYLDGEIAHISMSVGIAVFPNNGLTINELIKNADIAMYCAKNSGKNSYKLFDSYMEDDVNRKNDLEDILNNVIENNEIYLMYQPQVNVATGKITGYEALMRIDSEIAGFVSPAEFIPIAEDSGIINKLGEWALYEACRFNQNLIDDGFEPIKVSVNVSTTQLQDNRLLSVIKSIPRATGMELKHLEIEITESVLMNSFEHNLELINKMKEMGVTIALDDFGTGYSSFNYLTQIPIDTLKIDKSFIDGICKNEKDRCIADSIISLAHKMNISVVAEGVEDKEQLQILQEQFCDTLQGYLFSKPLKSGDFITLMKKYS